MVAEPIGAVIGAGGTIGADGGVTFFSLSIASAAPRLGVAIGFGAGVGARAGLEVGVGVETGGTTGVEDEGIRTEGAEVSLFCAGVLADVDTGDAVWAGALDGCPIPARIFDMIFSFTSLAMEADCSALIFKLSAIYGANSCGSVSPSISCPVSASKRPVWSMCRECPLAMSLTMPPISLLYRKSAAASGRVSIRFPISSDEYTFLAMWFSLGY